jgi:magnesium chelatase subunit I
LDAAAQGNYTVHRGPLSATYRSRFALIGSMNPEEGQLRPQILDRFGLRVIVRGLTDREERLEAYRRSVEFLKNPRRLVNAYAQGTSLAQEELDESNKSIKEVALSTEAEELGLELIQRMGIESLRAEITLFEAARAYSIADGRMEATMQDVHAVAPMALRLRRSSFIKDYLSTQSQEEQELTDLLSELSQSEST